MSRTILTTLFLASLGVATSTLPSAALPVASPTIIGSAHADLVQVRMSRHSMRHRRMRSRSGSGNASMPSRAPGAQQYGQTTGGPRRR